MSACTLYTTTFPCTLCAEKIIHAGIKTVVYMEAYPDKTGRLLLGAAGVELRTCLRSVMWCLGCSRGGGRVRVPVVGS